MNLRGDERGGMVGSDVREIRYSDDSESSDEFCYTEGCEG